jgi:hypothetical protein
MRSWTWRITASASDHEFSFLDVPWLAEYPKWSYRGL